MQGEVHAGGRGIGNDTLNLGHCIVAFGTDDLARFIIDNPGADAGLYPTRNATKRTKRRLPYQLIMIDNASFHKS